MADIQPRGLSRGLTNYGDADFSLYLRRSFASSMGFSRKMLDRPIGSHLSFGERLQQLPSWRALSSSTR